MDPFENQMKSKDLCPKTCIWYKSAKSMNPLKISQGSKDKERKVFFFDKYGKLLKEMIFFSHFQYLWCISISYLYIRPNTWPILSY